VSKYLGKLFVYVATIMVFSFGVSVYSASAGPSAVRKWQTKIVRLIAKKQVYPRSAMRRELEGRARVRIQIDRTGAIISHKVIKPTGKAVFDREIPRLLARINPLPAPPASMSDSQLSFILPLAWVIR